MYNICLRKFQLVLTGSAFLQGMTYVDRSTQPRVKTSVGKKRRTSAQWLSAGAHLVHENEFRNPRNITS
jgi:hypothetical protein